MNEVTPIGWGAVIVFAAFIGLYVLIMLPEWIAYFRDRKKRK